MPPKRQQEDPAALKEKLHAQQATGARGRRNNATNGANGSHLKEVMTSNADNASTHSGQTERNASGIPWKDEDREVLQGYRRKYHIDTPSSFKNPLAHAVLGHGIGKYSPTMARPKNKRRVPKDQLALAVRKNFNANGVNETDVIVDLLYKVKNQDKEFRVRFPPRK